MSLLAGFGCSVLAGPTAALLYLYVVAMILATLLVLAGATTAGKVYRRRRSALEALRSLHPERAGLGDLRAAHRAVLALYDIHGGEAAGVRVRTLACSQLDAIASRAISRDSYDEATAMLLAAAGMQARDTTPVIFTVGSLPVDAPADLLVWHHTLLPGGRVRADTVAGIEDLESVPSGRHPLPLRGTWVGDRPTGTRVLLAPTWLHAALRATSTRALQERHRGGYWAAPSGISEAVPADGVDLEMLVALFDPDDRGVLGDLAEVAAIARIL